MIPTLEAVLGEGTVSEQIVWNSYWKPRLMLNTEPISRTLSQVGGNPKRVVSHVDALIRTVATQERMEAERRIRIMRAHARRKEASA